MDGPTVGQFYQFLSDSDRKQDRSYTNLHRGYVAKGTLMKLHKGGIY